MKPYRKQRLEKEIKKIISQIILYEMKDPRVGFVSIPRVELSRDLKFADIYVSVMGEKKDKVLTMQALTHGRKFIRTMLAQRLQIRSVPQIRFHLDTSIERSIAVSQILDEISAQSSSSRDQEE